MMHTLFSAAGFELHSAPFMVGLSGLAALLYFKSLNRHTGLSEDNFWELMALVVPGVMAGAVAFYFLAYGKGPLENLRYMSTINRLAGGSFFGAYWSAILFAAAYCRFRRLDAARVADAVALAAFLGLPIMRLGCLMNGCCHGLPTALPWGIVFTDPACAVRTGLLGRSLHPTQLYEAAGSLAIFFAGRKILHSRLARPGGVFAFSTAAYAVLRFFADFTRAGDPDRFTAWGFSTAQLLFALSAAGSLLWYRLKSR